MRFPSFLSVALMSLMLSGNSMGSGGFLEIDCEDGAEEPSLTPDFVEKVRCEAEAAGKGDARAQYELGLAVEVMAGKRTSDEMFRKAVAGLKGSGVKELSGEAAWQLLAKSARQGYVPAVKLLAARILAGENGKLNDESPEYLKHFEAAVVLKKAADQGNVEAMAELGLYFQEGIGVAKDKTEAQKWLRKACEAGCGRAWVILGRGLLGNQPAEARRCFEQGAARGFPLVMAELGKCHLNGVGGRADIAQGVQLLKKAAEAGDGTALCELGKCYMEGKGVERDIWKALELTEKAAELNNSAACLQLFEWFFEGKGVAKDQSVALRFQSRCNPDNQLRGLN